MPNAVVKSYAKKTGKSVQHVERWWEEAKEDAAKKFKKKSPRYWAYVNGIVRRRAGLEEAVSFKEFMGLLSEMQTYVPDPAEPESPEGYCTECGAPIVDGIIDHAPDCPFRSGEVAEQAPSPLARGR